MINYLSNCHSSESWNPEQNNWIPDQVWDDKNRNEVINIIKKKLFFPVLALTIIGTGLVKANFVSAQDTTGPNSLITAIAQRFNLNETDVKEVFEDEKSKRQSEIKARMEQKLTQAVADGKITGAQKQAISEKFGTPFTKKFEPGQFKELTEEEIKSLHGQKKAEMDTWLSQNGLTQEVLNDVMGHPKGFGGKRVIMLAH